MFRSFWVRIIRAKTYMLAMKIPLGGNKGVVGTPEGLERGQGKETGCNYILN